MIALTHPKMLPLCTALVASCSRSSVSSTRVQGMQSFIFPLFDLIQTVVGIEGETVGAEGEPGVR